MDSNSYLPVERERYLDLEALVEEISLSASMRPRTSLSLSDHLDSRHESVLLKFGFEYGLTGETLWGVDNQGRDWVAWIAGHLGQRHMAWYIQDAKGVKTRQPQLTYSEFLGLFGV